MHRTSWMAVVVAGACSSGTGSPVDQVRGADVGSLPEVTVMSNMLVDGPIVTIDSPREARPNETVRVDARQATEVRLPPARNCPGAAVEIKEVAEGEEVTMVIPAPGDTIEGQPHLRISGGVQQGVRRYVALRSDGAADAFRRGDDPATAGGDWAIVAERGLW